MCHGRRCGARAARRAQPHPQHSHHRPRHRSLHRAPSQVDRASLTDQRAATSPSKRAQARIELPFSLRDIVPLDGREGGAQGRMRVRVHVAMPAARDASQTAGNTKLQSAPIPATAPSPQPLSRGERGVITYATSDPGCLALPAGSRAPRSPPCRCALPVACPPPHARTRPTAQRSMHRCPVQRTLR